MCGIVMGRFMNGGALLALGPEWILIKFVFNEQTDEERMIGRGQKEGLGREGNWKF